MRRITFQTEERIIELWFKGLPRDTIARRTGVSGSTVSKIISYLPECLRELRDLSRELRKIGISPSEALKGTKLHSKLADLGVEPDQLKDFLKATGKLSRKAEYQPKQVVQAAMKLSDLEETSGKLYVEAIREFKTKTEQTPKLEEKNVKLQEEIDKKDRTRKQRLRQNRVTAKEIEYVKALRQTFRRYGISLTDAENLLEYLKNMQEIGGNPKKFIRFTREHGSLKGRSTYLENQKKQKAIELKEIEDNIETAGKELSKRQTAVSRQEKKEDDIVQRLGELEEKEAQQKIRLKALAASLAQMLGVKAGVTEMNMAINARTKKLQNIEATIAGKENVLREKQLEIQKLEEKKQSLELEVKGILKIKDYATELKTAIKGLEQREASLEKKCAEMSAQIALGDTTTNFLTRQPTSDFNDFHAMVENVKRIREDKSSPLRHLLPRIEEGIRMKALEAFKGDYVSKIVYDGVYKHKEEYRDENIELKKKLKRQDDELPSVRKEKDFLENLKVYVEGGPRTLKDLRDWTISVCEEEIENRAKEKYHALAAATQGTLNWVNGKLKKKH